MESFYIAKNGQQFGPFDKDTIRTKVLSGEYARTDFCWQAGMDDWASIQEAIELPPALSVDSLKTVQEDPSAADEKIQDQESTKKQFGSRHQESASDKSRAIADEKIVEIIWDANFRTFPANQTWHIFLTSKRIIFQRFSWGIEEIAFGFFARKIRNSVSNNELRSRSLNDISVEEIIARKRKVVIIDDSNYSWVSTRGNSIILSLPGGKTYKLTTAPENIRRLRDKCESYGWSQKIN